VPDFAPRPGKITQFHAPGGLGVRMDSALYDGYTIPSYYDSLIGKLIVQGRDRPEALARLKRALSELIIDGQGSRRPFRSSTRCWPKKTSRRATIRFTGSKSGWPALTVNDAAGRALVIDACASVATALRQGGPSAMTEESDVLTPALLLRAYAHVASSRWPRTRDSQGTATGSNPASAVSSRSRDSTSRTFACPTHPCWWLRNCGQSRFPLPWCAPAPTVPKHGSTTICTNSMRSCMRRVMPNHSKSTRTAH
jgi:acetyl/propionyl-CoA carboxylase alpha subunit